MVPLHPFGGGRGQAFGKRCRWRGFGGDVLVSVVGVESFVVFRLWLPFPYVWMCCVLSMVGVDKRRVRSADGIGLVVLYS